MDVPNRLIFMSYARNEMYYAEALAHDLEALGLPIWFDLQQLVPGCQWQKEIEAGLNSSTELILVVSRASLKSPYVAQEVQHAIERNSPIYLVIMENVPDVPLLKQLRECAAAIIDGRRDYAAASAQLIAAVQGKIQPKDAVQGGLVFPRTLWTVIGCMALLIITMLGVGVSALAIYPPMLALSAAGSMFIVLEMRQLMTRRSFNGTRLTLFIGALYCFLFVPLLLPVLVGGWLLSLVARDMTRYAPRGEGLRRGDESAVVALVRATRTVDPLLNGIANVIVYGGIMIPAAILAPFALRTSGLFSLIVLVGAAGVVYLVLRAVLDFLRLRITFANWLTGSALNTAAWWVFSLAAGPSLSERQDNTFVLYVAVLVSYLMMIWIAQRLINRITARYDVFQAPPVTKSGVTFKLFQSPKDTPTGNAIGEALSKNGHTQIFADRESTINFLLLTNNITEGAYRKLDLNNGLWVILLAASLDPQAWHEELTAYQWLDYRQRDIEQLNALMRELAGNRDKISSAVSTRTTPQSFAQLVLPLRVKAWLVVQFTLSILVIIGTVRALFDPDPVLPNWLNLPIAVISLVLGFVILVRVMRREITIQRMLNINLGFTVISVLIGFFWGLTQPLPFGYVRDWGAILSFLIGYGIGMVLGYFVGYRVMDSILGGWLPETNSGSWLSWRRDRGIYLRALGIAIVVTLVSILLFGNPVQYQQDVSGRSEEIPAAAVIRHVNGVSGDALADALSSVVRM